MSYPMARTMRNNLIHLNILVEIIINSYFNNSKCVFIISDECTDFKVDQISAVVLNPKDGLLDEQLIFNNYGCKAILINHENPLRIFEQFENLIKHKSERWNTRKYIILANQDENSFLSSIFQSKAIEYISDLVAIFGWSINSKERIKVVPQEFYNIWSHPYGGNDGSNNVPKIIDKWYSKNGSFLHGADLYPNKLGNQFGRTLKFGSFTYEPFSIIDSQKKIYGGTEITFAFEFSKRLNVTPVIIEADTEFNWGIVYHNYTGVGMFGDLVEDKVDIGFAAVYTWEDIYQFFDYSRVWIRSGISLIVPAPRLGIGWAMALNSFSPKMWIATALSFILCTLVLFIISVINEDFEIAQKKKSLLLSLTIVVRSFLNQPLPRILKTGHSLHFVIALIHLQAVFLISGYTSGYASVLAIPKYEDAIKTVDDFVDRKLIWGGITSLYLLSIENIDEEKYQTMTSLFSLKTNEELEQVSRSTPRDFGFAFERLPYGYFAIGTFMKEDAMVRYRLMEEDLYWSYCIFLTRKNSILLPLMDKLLSRVFDAGLVTYMQAHAVRTYMDVSIQRIASYYTHSHAEDDRAVAPLRWDHVKGVFATLALGYVSSLVVFVAEILLHDQANAQRAQNFKKPA